MCGRKRHTHCQRQRRKRNRNYWLVFIKMSKNLVPLQQYLLIINFYIMAKYKLYLSSEERAELLANLRKYKSNSGKVMTSQILLHSDENVADAKMTSAALSPNFSLR